MLEVRHGKVRGRWTVESNSAWNRADVDMAALGCLALQRALPDSERIEPAVNYLLSDRPWGSGRARGLSLAALAQYYGETGVRGDRAEVVVSVDGEELESLRFDGAAPGRRLTIAGDAFDEVRVRIDLEVRGSAELFYDATLRGFTPEVPEQVTEAPGCRSASSASSRPRRTTAAGRSRRASRCCRGAARPGRTR